MNAIVCIIDSNQSSLHAAVCYHSRYSFGVPSIFLRLNSAHSRSTNCANWSVQSAQELKKTAEAVFLSHWPDSNRRPTHYECVALPTEPQWQAIYHLVINNVPFGEKRVQRYNKMRLFANFSQKMMKFSIFGIIFVNRKLKIETITPRQDLF